MPRNTGVWTAKHLIANASTLVKGVAGDTSYPSRSAGILHGVTINTKGATANTLTLYDGTDATGGAAAILAIIDTTAFIGQIQYDIGFNIGLYAVMATGTAADITIEYQ